MGAQNKVKYIKSALPLALIRAKDYYGEEAEYRLVLISGFINWYLGVPAEIRPDKKTIRTYLGMKEDLEAGEAESTYTDKWLDGFIDDYVGE